MKSEIYKIIAFTIFFIIMFLLFRQWMDYMFIKAEYCGHIDRVNVIKLKEQTFTSKNEIGEDSSCYVFHNLHGKLSTKRSQYWNVGNCDGTEIKVDVLDYICH